MGDIDDEVGEDGIGVVDVGDGIDGDDVAAAGVALVVGGDAQGRWYTRAICWRQTTRTRSRWAARSARWRRCQARRDTRAVRTWGAPEGAGAGTEAVAAVCWRLAGQDGLQWQR